MYQIIEDNQGNLWLSTKGGISCFNPEKKTFRNYTVEDGLPANFLYPGVFNKFNRKLYYGTEHDGLIFFDPNRIRINLIPPNVAISELTVYDINGNERTIDAISAKNNLSLSYKNNTLKFNLASLSYQKSNKNKYAYRIPEINDFWINLDKNRELTLTNLKPGNYSFIYKGSNGDGIWSEPGGTQDQDHPSFLGKSWWAPRLYGLFFAGMLYTFYRFQLDRKLEKAEATRLRDTFKSRFYTNITHEFRTPLTVILGIVRTIKSNQKKWFEKGTKMIKRNANNLLHLVNQMLGPVSKLEAGMLTVNLEQADIVKYLRYIVESFHSSSQQKKITIHLLNDMDQLVMDYDPEKIRNII